MSMPYRLAVAVATFILCLPLHQAAAQTAAPVPELSGEATDASGGALPGVSVTVSSSTQPPRTVVTDGAGRFVFRNLESGSYDVSFELAGFETVQLARVRVGAGEPVVLNQRLHLASLNETVMVFAPAPVEIPPPAPFIPRAPDVVPVPPELLASVCGPSDLGAAAPVARVASHRDEQRRQLFGHGDLVVLDAGTAAGLSVGTNLVVLRTFHAGRRDRYGRAVPVGEHGAGLLQVVESTADAATAAVVYACDEFAVGDRVERFDPQPQWQWRALGAPDYADPGRVLFGDDGQTMAGPQQLMVIDQGRNHGLTTGQWLTLFRRSGPEGGPVSHVGRAVVVAIKDRTATIRIESARDAVVVGDLVAPHRDSQ